MEKMKARAIKLLRSLEKYTKTDMLYVAKGGFWLGIGQFVAAGSAFLMSVAFANLLDPGIYGIYKFVLSINSLILITTLTGMDSAVTQSISRGYEGTLQMGLKEKMRWGVLGSIISLGVALYYYSQGNFSLAACFSIIALFVPFTESTDLYNSLLWGKKLFNIQAKYNVINLIVTLCFTTTALFFTHNLYVILLVYLCTMTIPNIFFYWNTKQNYQTNDTVDPEARRYGKHLSAINIIGLVLAQLDKVLVFHYVGAVDLAVYSLAVAPTDQIKGLLKNLNAIALPKFSERTSQEIKSTIWHKTGALALGSLVIVLIYILCAPLLFKIFFPKYIASITYSQILAISIVFAILSSFLYTILESQKATTQLYHYNITNYTLNLLILFPLVVMYGLWGAVFSRLISRAIGLMLSAYYVKKLE